MTNPYAPPTAAVRDIPDTSAHMAQAERGTRLGAAILDTLVFFAMVYLPLFAGAVAGGVTAGAESGGFVGVGVLLMCVGFAAWLGFTIHHMRNGQSIGKKMVGIKVVRTDGSPISLGRFIWLRTVLNWIISLIPLYGLVDVLFIFGEARQCLHDRLADTIVVKA